MAALIGLAAAWAAAGALAGPGKGMLARGGVKNFAGKAIPTGMGAILLVAVLSGLGLLTLTGLFQGEKLSLCGFWLTLVCLAGLVDDAFGDHESRGFRGHFRALFQGRLTTGMAKVLLVTLGAGLISLPLSWQSLPEIGVLILSVNFFNQLDLRPGRALKVFLLISGGLAAAGSVTAAVGWGGALGLLPGDLRSDYMLGDAGANLLGALAGLAIVTALSQTGIIIALALLVLGNGAGEFLSFSAIIAKSKFLTWLDQIGRPQAGK